MNNDNWFSPQEIKNMRLILGGITQKEFAALVGVTVHAVENWEQSRKRPDRRSLIALEKLRSKM